MNELTHPNEIGEMPTDYPDTEQVRSLLNRGEKPEMIAQTLGVQMTETKKVSITQRQRFGVATTPTHNEPRDILAEQLYAVIDVISIAKDAYEDKPSQGNAIALSTLITTIQNLLGDLEKHKAPEAQVQLIDERILQPMITDMVRDLTNEMNTARNEIIKHVEIAKQGIVMEAIKQGLTGFGQKAKSNYAGGIVKLKDLLGVKE